MPDTLEFHGVTFYHIPGQKACFKVENGIHYGYVSPRAHSDTLYKLIDAIKEDKRRRLEELPPNIRRLVERIYQKPNPKKIIAVICELIQSGAVF